MRLMRWVLVGLILLIVIVGSVLIWMGGGYYARAIWYVRQHPETQVIFRAEKNQGAVAGIYAGVWRDKIWLWRDGWLQGYGGEDEVDAEYIAGCSAPNYDETKMKATAVGSINGFGELARKGDFVMLTLSRDGEQKIIKIMGSDYWIFVGDNRLEVQCNARN